MDFGKTGSGVSKILKKEFNRIVLVVSIVVAVGMGCVTIVNPVIGILSYYTEDIIAFILIEPSSSGVVSHIGFLH